MKYDSILRSAANKRHFHSAKAGRKAFTLRAYVHTLIGGDLITTFGSAIHCGPLNTRAKVASVAHTETYRVRVIPK